MPKLASKAVTAEAMKAKGLAKKPRKGASAKGATGKAGGGKSGSSEASKSDALFAVIAGDIDDATPEGRKRLELLRLVHSEGLSLRWLMAYEMNRLLDVMASMDNGHIEPAKGHVQLDKITDRLKQLVIEDEAPDETVPGNIVFTVPLPPEADSGPGDPIRVVSARDVRHIAKPDEAAQ